MADRATDTVRRYQRASYRAVAWLAVALILLAFGWW